MSSPNSAATGGIGFIQLLTVLFIGLKLTGFISWSWLWVLSPLWIPLAAVVVLIIVICFGDFLSDILKERKKQKAERRQ